MTSKSISTRGAREHNLKDVNLELPRKELIVITANVGLQRLALPRLAGYSGSCRHASGIHP